jgi:hypothetical protein
MPNYTSEKLAFHNAEQFKESFYEPEPTTIGYVFIGNHIAWSNEDSPDNITDTVKNEKSVWDNIYAAKRVTGNDVELVIPRVNWTGNTRYRQFDDTVQLSELLSANTTQNLKPMYVINTERDVYLCMCNNVSANSTVEPSGQNLTANGVIETGDGYLWKYLYNVRASNRFLTDNFVPAPVSTSKLDYSTSANIAVDGELAKIVVTNRGTGYIHSNITVSSFQTGCTILTIVGTDDTVSPNLSASIQNTANMSIAGTGIGGAVFVQSVDPVNLRITLSSGATANGGGSNVANSLFLSTRVYIDGDGTTVLCQPRLSGNTVEKMTVTTRGRGYTFANVRIFGTGTEAAARAVLPPKFGHGFNSAKQLGATNVMVVMRIGEIDTTENGLISANTTFRQYGLLRDPYKYGSSTQANTAVANSVISQTTNLTLVSGPVYNINEFVYQGPSANAASFSGYINDYTTNEVRLTRVRGTAQVGAPLIGANTNPSGRRVIAQKNPEFQPYTGDIMHVENIVRTERTEGQAEVLKFVVKF